MSPHHDDPSSTTADAATPELSRRALIGGLTAAGAFGLAASGALPGGIAHAAPGDQTEALDPTVAGLVYTTFDAAAFFPGNGSRVYQESPATGTQPLSPPTHILAAMPIPVGAVIRQINVSFQGQPIISIARRDFTTGAFVPVTDLFNTTAGGGVKTQSFTTDVTFTHGGSYVLRAFCSNGDSILGMSVGYVPAPQAFIPFTGAQPRALDTRESGFTKFGTNEERVIDLSSRLIPTARAAVINLTATETNGGGFLSAYADGISWPGNSSVNYSGANQTVANAAVVTMTNGRIKVRAGVNGAHVIVDVVGSLL
jgi:hypothetical protein